MVGAATPQVFPNVLIVIERCVRIEKVLVLKVTLTRIPSGNRDLERIFTMRFTKKTTVLGLGAAIAACGVCCAPLLVPLAIALGGISAFWGGFLALGFSVLMIAGYYVWLRHKKSCGC